MTDRFDLEQQIMKCWSITEEVQLLNEQVLENDTLTKDQISNYVEKCISPKLNPNSSIIQRSLFARETCKHNLVLR
jgi:hypothetical protein